MYFFFFFSSRRRHTRFDCDWSSDVCSSDLNIVLTKQAGWKAEGVVSVKNFDDALFLVKEMDIKEVMVIGGGEIYRSVFEKADRKSTRLNSSHSQISYAVFCLKKKKKKQQKS